MIHNLYIYSNYKINNESFTTTIIKNSSSKKARYIYILEMKPHTLNGS